MLAAVGEGSDIGSGKGDSSYAAGCLDVIAVPVDGLGQCEASAKQANGTIPFLFALSKANSVLEGDTRTWEY